MLTFFKLLFDNFHFFLLLVYFWA